jgi:hypothetical protein
LKKSSLGWVELKPHRKVVAGEYSTWRIIYTAGSKGIKKGGKLIIAQRWPCDWGEPQFSSPSSPDFLNFKTPPGVEIKPHYERRSYIHPWDNALYLTIDGRNLIEGEQITIIYGDKSSGSPGSRAQTFIETNHKFLVLIDAEGDGNFKRVPGKASVQVVGGDVEKLIITVPSILLVGEEGYIHVRSEDIWGNPCPHYKGKLIFKSTDSRASLPKEIHFRSKSGAQKFRGIVFNTPGVHKIFVEDKENGLVSESNPFLVTDHVDFKIFWGDIHGQANVGCGAGTVEEYFAYLKNIAGVDFGAYQGNDNLISSSGWINQRKVIEKHNLPGEFVTFHGYEWSDVYDSGGHHNIYFLEDEEEIRRCNHKFIEDKSDACMDLSPITEVYKFYRSKIGKVLIVPHVGGEPANLNFHDEELEKLIEVHSTHGTFEWFIQDALERGYKVGFIAGSDDVMGRPGASHPGYHYARFVRNGLCAVFAKSLSRQDIWEALLARRTYATTGSRIIIFFKADGHFMGEEYITGEPITFTARVIGTTGLEEVKIMRGLETVFEYPMPERKFDGRVRVYWEGSTCKDTGLRSYAEWDGIIELEGGEIEKVEGYAFDTPREGICEFSRKHVVWKSQTSGDRDGIILYLKEHSPTTVLVFKSKQIEFKLSLEELDRNGGKWVKYVGPVNRKVTVDYPLLKTINEIEFTFKDIPSKAGTYPYYLKVVQSDGNQAWTSPIYITVNK